MDSQLYMIVDLERCGDKCMFITEQVSSISENKNGLWAVRFSSSTRVFNYNKARLLYFTDPETIDFSEKGLYIKNKHINNVAEVLRFSDTRHTFYRVTYPNGYYENFEGNDVYITRTPIDKNGGSTWEYLRKLAAETGLMTEDEDNILSKQYELVDTMRDNVPVIMDEASQVDIKTGALALSCAMNAVIVGDDKQLPNVVSREEALALNAIQTTYNVDDRYNAMTHSFLQSCVEVFTEAPVTLLREHYRCHPKIIEFCNQRFYNGELVAMTTDNGEENVLQVVRTTKGNHAREHFNQREIDVIIQEVMPEYKYMDSVGIITPYRNQAEETNKALGHDIASTVHKYQGRECDSIIISTVDNEPTEFSDDANLLNVAISRAKTRLCIVTNGNELPKESNLAQLIAYIQYNNFEVKESKLHSVFDLLYKQYTAERLAYEAAHPSVSNHLSENLVYTVLVKAIADLNLINAEILCHYPLSRLISDWSLLSEEEKAFAKSPFSHIDFLIYNSLTKQPLQTIEVDGWHFHQNSDVQQSRDALKDRLLTKFGLCPHRISTTETVNVETIKKIILISS